MSYHQPCPECGTETEKWRDDVDYIDRCPKCKILLT